MVDNSQRVENLTSESIERLHIVNEIRDRLQENNGILESLGILRVLGFGSAIKGSSTEDSDVDISFLKRRKPHQDFSDFIAEEERVKNGISLILEGLKYKVVFRPTQPALGQDNRVIHVTTDSVDDRNHLPSYVEDPILLWESDQLKDQQQTRPTSLLIKKIRELF